MTTVSAGLDWLVDSLTQRTPDIAHAILVSADGMPMASSRDFPPDRADQLAAITSGLTSLTMGAARCFAAGCPARTPIGPHAPTTSLPMG